MGKRFTDSSLWDKEWFVALKPEEKCAFFYIKDICDSVGVWSVNERLAEFVIGSEVDWNALPSKTHGNLELLKNGHWFLPDFCAFQYGVLSENCKPHQSYMASLKKHGLYQRVLKGYGKRLQTSQEKEKELEKELEKEKEKEKTRYGEHVLMKSGEYDRLLRDFGKAIITDMIGRLDDYIGSKGRRYKSHYCTIRTWLRNDGVKPRVTTPGCPACGHVQETNAASCLQCWYSKDGGENPEEYMHKVRHSTDGASWRKIRKAMKLPEPEEEIEF